MYFALQNKVLYSTLIIRISVDCTCFEIIFTQIQVALRHKSEIEHHRNKIRLRAKRKGHYDFPAMDDVTSGLRDVKDPDRIYQKAQMQINKILDPDVQMPAIFMESKKRLGGGEGHFLIGCL